MDESHASPGTHYSNNLAPGVLWRQAQNCARHIRDRCRTTRQTPVLCYSGMSGIGLGVAVAMALVRQRRPIRFYQFFVRKPDDQHHHWSYLYEHNFSRAMEDFDVVICPDKFLGVFVDDCVSTGITYRRVRDTLLANTNIRIGARYLSNDGIYEPWVTWTPGDPQNLEYMPPMRTVIKTEKLLGATAHAV